MGEKSQKAGYQDPTSMSSSTLTDLTASPNVLPGTNGATGTGQKLSASDGDVLLIGVGTQFDAHSNGLSGEHVDRCAKKRLATHVQLNSII